MAAHFCKVISLVVAGWLIFAWVGVELRKADKQIEKEIGKGAKENVSADASNVNVRGERKTTGS